MTHCENKYGILLCTTDETVQNSFSQIGQYIKQMHVILVMTEMRITEFAKNVAHS